MAVTTILIFDNTTQKGVGRITISGISQKIDFEIFGAGMGFIMGGAFWTWDLTAGNFFLDLYDGDPKNGNNVGELHGTWTVPLGGPFPNLPWFGPGFITGNITLFGKNTSKVFTWVTT